MLYSYYNNSSYIIYKYQIILQETHYTSMSTYALVFYVSNIILPIGLIAYKTYIKIGSNQETVQNFENNYGKWFLFVLSIILFNILRFLIKKNYTIMMIGFIVKLLIIYLPSSLNVMVEESIRKRHLQFYLQKIKTTFIDFYFKITWKFNLYLLHSSTNDAQRNIIIQEIKDIISKVQLDFDDQKVKNKAFSIKKDILLKTKKLYENIGVNCDIITHKETTMNRELIKILSSKQNRSGIQNDQSFNQSNSSQMYPTNEAPQNIKDNKVAQFGKRSSKNLSRISKQTVSNKLLIPSGKQTQIAEQQHLIIKKSNSELADQFNETNSPKRIRMKSVLSPQNPDKIINKSKVHDAPDRSMTDRPMMQNSQTFSQSMISQNLNNRGFIYGSMSNASGLLSNNMINENGMNDSQFSPIKKKTNQSNILNSEGQVIQVIPKDANISNIKMKRSQPFQINLSDITNPLIPSGTTIPSKILPASLYLTSSINNQPNSAQSNTPLSIKNKIPAGLSSISKVETQNNVDLSEKFSEQSSIQNKNEVSIGQSQYSDMFDSEGQNQQPDVQIKVEAVVENPRTSSGLKPRLDISNIQLYCNGEIKFYSLYDKCTFYGKLISMIKLPSNYYQMKIEEFDLKQSREIQSKHSEQKDGLEKPIIIKKVKFRGQAKPFMKYLEKTEEKLNTIS